MLTSTCYEEKNQQRSAKKCGLQVQELNCEQPYENGAVVKLKKQRGIKESAVAHMVIHARREKKKKERKKSKYRIWMSSGFNDTQFPLPTDNPTDVVVLQGERESGLKNSIYSNI